MENQEATPSEEIVVVKLTDWANEPSLKDLKQDYTDAQSDHSEHEANVEHWLENLNIEGKAKIEKIPGRSSVVPKLIRKQAEWRYAALSEPFLSTDDIYNINPVGPGDVNAARQNALILNNQFNTKIDKVRFIDEYVRAAVDEGTVVVRVGWLFEEEIRDVEVPVMGMVPTQDPQILQAYQQIQANPGLLAQAPPPIQAGFQASMNMGMPVVEQQVDTEIQQEPVTVKNQPTVDICTYTNTIVDPTCKGDMSKAGFVIYAFETSLSTLKKDKKYKNLENINLDSSSILGSEDSDVDVSFNFTDKPRKKFIAYEYWGYWDIDGTGMVKPFVATWAGDTMIRMEESPFPDGGLPFVSVQYLPVRGKIYGEPDGELLEDNQQIIGAVTRGMVDIMARSANGQQGSRKDALDLTNQRRFDNGDDYQFNQNVSPQEAFYMHTFPEIPQSAGLMLQVQNNEAESLTGVKAFSSSGISSQSLGDNATGIRSAMDATSKRELGILRRMSEGIKEIGRKVIAMNGIFLDEEEIVRISEEEFVPVKRDDLEGNFDLALSISTAEADNDKAQELAFMLQTNGPDSDPGEVRMIRAEIARLRKMPALAKQIEDYRPEPDPMQVKIQELEIAKLEAEIREIDSKTAENYAEAELDKASAKEKSSKADLNDLDFVEQESGTKQERDKELQGEQARANMLKDAASHVYKLDEEAQKQRIGGNNGESK